MNQIMAFRNRATTEKNSPKAYVLLICCSLFAVILSTTQIAHAQASPRGMKPLKPCAFMGTAIKVNSFKVPVCIAFHTRGSAIKLPKDSATRKYGLLVSNYLGSSDKPSATFITRLNKNVQTSIGLVPKKLLDTKAQVQYIYEIRIRNAKIISAKPIVYVPIATMLRPYTNKQFIGEVNNFNPPEGISASAWIRWDFANVAQSKLSGTFTNLNHAVRRTPILEPPAPCENAINDTSQLIEWYSPILGTKDSISMTWDPGMHTRLDSELVISMSTGVTYMTSTPALNELMTKTLDMQRQYAWTIHGNPLGTPYNFTGTFAMKTPVRPCSTG